MTVSLSAVHEQLRRDTAVLLGYDYATLTPAQSVRLDRCAMLRLELDDCQQKKLSGQPFDLTKYVIASEALERMFGGHPDGSSTSEFAGAREELAALIMRRVEAIRARDEAQCDAAQSNPGGGDVEQAGAAQPSTPPELRAAVGTEPEPPPAPPWGVPPTEPAAASPPETDIERMNRVNAQRPPAHYLKGPDEPWRPFVNEDGIRTR
jgi:hypothetical protein